MTKVTSIGTVIDTRLPLSISREAALAAFPPGARQGAPATMLADGIDGVRKNLAKFMDIVDLVACTQGEAVEGLGGEIGDLEALETAAALRRGHIGHQSGGGKVVGVDGRAVLAHVVACACSLDIVVSWGGPAQSHLGEVRGVFVDLDARHCDVMVAAPLG